MHSNTHPNVDLEPEDNIPNAQANPQNPISWHLVPTLSVNPRVESVSPKPSLKLKIVRHPVNKQNFLRSKRQATREQKPEHVSLIKSTNSKNELNEQKSTTVEVDSKPFMSQKRTPWYLLPRKLVREAECPEPVSLESTVKERNAKQRVANKPNPDFWDLSHKMSEELFVKLESCKKKIVKPPKLQHAPCEKTTVLPLKRPITHSPDQQASSSAKMPALNFDIQGTASIALKKAKEHSQLDGDFVLTQEARKRAEQLMYLKGTDEKYKSQGFKKPICSKRIVKKYVFTPCTSVSETSLDFEHNNAIQDMGNVVSLKKVIKESGEVFDFRSEQQKPNVEGFKIPPCEKSVNVKIVTDPSIENSKTFLNSKNHNPVQPMNNIAANKVLEQAKQLFDLKSSVIQQMPKIAGFKIPICPKSHAKNAVDNHSTERSKIGTKHNMFQSVDFEAAKEARKKAEKLVQRGSITLTGKKTDENFKQATTSKRPSVFDELLSTENVSFTSLCAKVQESKETWSNCLDHIYASFSKKSCKEPKEKANGTKGHDAKKVNLATTIFVSCNDISEKFLLTFLTTFGTITAIFIKNRNEAIVVFHVPSAALRACTLTKGIATLGGVTMEIRMAAAEDQAVITRLQGGLQPNSPQPTGRSSGWREVAAVLSQNVSHCDSRELVTYTEADDMF